jgi:hypothetical protein
MEFNPIYTNHVTWYDKMTHIRLILVLIQSSLVLRATCGHSLLNSAPVDMVANKPLFNQKISLGNEIKRHVQYNFEIEICRYHGRGG